MAKWKNALLISTIVAPIAFGAGPLGDVLAAPINDKGTSSTATDVVVHKYLNTQDKGNNYYWGNGEAIESGDAPGGASAFSTANGWQKAQTGYTFTAYALPGDVIKGYSTQDDEKDKPEISTDYIIPIADVIAYLEGPMGMSAEDVEALTEAEQRETAATGADGVTPFAYAALASEKWSGMLTAELVPAAGETGAPLNTDGAGDSGKSNYTFVLDDDADKVAELITYLDSVDGQGTTPAKQTADTNASGDATFQDLSNNEWIIFETTDPAGDDSKLTRATPMVLNLPMMKSDGSAWFGTNAAYTGDKVGEPAVNLYPKDYLLQGSLKVVKSDIDGQKLAGVDFLLLQDSSTGAAGIAKLREDIASNLKFVVTYDANKKVTSVDVADPQTTEGAQTIVELGTAEVTALVESARYGLSVVDEQTTGDGKNGSELGVAKFSVKPNEVYYVMETSIGTNENVDEIDVVQQVETTPYKEDEEDVNADGKVYYANGEYKISNLPIPEVDKKIAVQNLMDNTYNLGVFQDNDYVTGVSRGEHFQYKVAADFNKYLASDVHAPNASGPAQLNGYNKFEIVDTFDPEVDITGFQIGTTIGSTYTPLYNVVLTINGESQAVDGGFSSNGGTYDVEVYAVSDTDKTTDLYNTGADPLKNYMTISGHASSYDTSGGKSIDKDAETSVKGEITLSLTPNAGGTDTKTDPGDFSTNPVAKAFVDALTAASASKGQVTLIMDAQTNSAATVGDLNNKVDLTSQSVYGSPTADDDTSKTYNAGWEFVKTDADNQKLENAGFDLSRIVTGSDTQGDRLLNADSKILNTDFTDEDVLNAYVAEAKKLGTGTGWYLGGATGSTAEAAFTAALKAYDAIATPTDTDKATLADALLKVMNDSAQYVKTGEPVYFAHLDEHSAPAPDMKKTGEMGDVLWTPYKELATTHYTDENGYFQYCGLASGPYTLSETDVPSGYDKVDDIKFFIADETLMAGTTLGADGMIDLDDNPYATGKPNADTEKSAAWIATATAFNAAGGNKVYQLLNDSWSDDKITGTDTTLNLVNLAKQGDVVQVKNYEKSIFPLVGGLGTLFAVIAGLLAMGLALLKRKKDMKNEA
ncbi:SpaA isopeptide-forming pilin-related protein [Weissella confusa]|uniref:SpaA isopeptide-forming pilin-related protein n=1 Tax=Weissella confusa TaxID=1583 RepID=UPI00070540AF|nr:SpaA isopeptide-forming pilin-related protein [Weissella confusa]KRN24205.1 hypothetical protein IV69_GL000686 [Weissella confusa]MBJ7698012.1 hypothetical protein [Weissella confusa]MBS7550125.1 prealbumin-like fold domain-containing protein [Weissella confusa]MCQ8095963.1 SpaA isopeptide-forming pilin-related protein [Weissella confusa]MCQ8145393.1 SpaA isopeptide-forming pilin-related protein [Weissella confusa]